MKVYLIIDFDYVVKVFAKQEDADAYVEQNPKGVGHRYNMFVEERDVE